MVRDNKITLIGLCRLSMPASPSSASYGKAARRHDCEALAAHKIRNSSKLHLSCFRAGIFWPAVRVQAYNANGELSAQQEEAENDRQKR